MATFRAIFDNSKQGIAGVWRPLRDDGEPVIIDETIDFEASDAGHTVVTFETLDDPMSFDLMVWALNSNDEVVEWEITDSGQYIMAREQVTDTAPRQRHAGASGMTYQTGKNVVVYYEPYHDWYGYYFEGVDENGNAFQSNHVGRFHTFRHALDTGLDEAEEERECACSDDKESWDEVAEDE